MISFVAIQAFLVWLSQRREILRDPDFGYVERRLKRVFSWEGRPHLIVALGSSRTCTGFRAQTVGEDLSEAWSRKVLAFNFAKSGFGPLMELVYLRRLLDDGVRPDLVLVEVFPALLADRNNGLVEERLRHSELAALAERGHLDADAPARWWREALSPARENRQALLAEILPQWVVWWHWLPEDRWGWEPYGIENPTPEYRQRATEAARKSYREVLATGSFRPATIDAVRQILALAKERSIPAVVLVLPEGPTFRSWYSSEVAARVDSFLASLDAPLIDARTWMEEDDFVDSHHLLPSGATRFSHLLSKELDRLASPNR